MHIEDRHSNLKAASLEILWPGAWEDCSDCGACFHVPYRDIHRERCGRSLASAPSYPSTTLISSSVSSSLPPTGSGSMSGIGSSRDSLSAITSSQVGSSSSSRGSSRSVSTSIANAGQSSSSSGTQQPRSRSFRGSAAGGSRSRTGNAPTSSSASREASEGIGESPQEDSPVHEDPEAAVNHDDVSVDLSIADAYSLLSWFHFNLHRIAHQWVADIRALNLILLERHMDASRGNVINDRNFLASMLLPGIIEFIRRDAQRGLVKPTLASFIAAPDAATAIIRRALNLRESFPHVVRRQDMDNTASLDAEQQRNVQERDLRQMYNQSYKNGRYKNAKNNLYAIQNLSRGIQPPARLTRQQELENIERLFPEANDMDSFPAADVSLDGQPLPDALAVSAEHVRDILPKLDKDTAPGTSGMTMAYFMVLFGGRSIRSDGSVCPPTAEQVLLTSLYNKVLTNSTTELVRTVLTGSRVVIIPKKGNSAVSVGRPLGIGEILYRVLGKIVSTIVGKKLADVMSPLQMAVGVKDSCIIMARVLQQLYDDGFAIIALDLENAFNTVRRRRIYDACRELAPELLGILRFSYADKSELRDSHGEFVRWCETGVRQGDPLSMLFFCLAIHKPLQEMEACRQAATRRAIAESSVDERIRGGLTFAYADDAFVATEVQIVADLFPQLVAIVERHGFQVNVIKCSITADNLDRLGFLFQDVIQSTAGHVHLGTPIGKPEYVKAELAGIVAKRLLDPDCIRGVVKAAEIFRLVSLCVNPSVVYLRRAAGYNPAKDALLSFDSGIEKVLRDALEVTEQTVDSDGTELSDDDIRLDTGLLHNRFNRLLRTPRALGGLGVYSHFGMEGERSELLVRLRVDAFVRKHGALSLCRFPDPNTQDDIRIGQSEDISDLVTRYTTLATDNDEFYCNMSLTTAPNLTRQAINAVRKAQMEQLYERLLSLEEDHPYLAYLRSATEDAGSGPLAWLKGCFGNEMRYFKEVIQFYLGFPSSPSQVPAGHRGYRCLCQLRRPRPASAPDPTRPCGFGHQAMCGECKKRINVRHRVLTEATASLLKEMLPTSTITLEPTVGTNARSGEAVVADILVKDAQGNVQYVLDVAVVMPSAQTYLRRSVGAHKYKDAAAIHEEQDKRRIYTPFVPGPKIIPFVLETTGRFGPSAKAFVKQICGDNTFRRSQFITQCSFILANGVGQMVQISHKYLVTFN
jgi:Reverse transcriptase (RNA-dependent DNA polymerase)